jgi:transglutaminase-like putative cysteine protease
MIINKTYIHSIKRKITPLDDQSGPAPIEHIVSFNDPDERPNIFYVQHKTTYQYTSPIAFSKHLFRLQPVHDLTQSVLNYEFNVSSKGEVLNFTGAFGNHASFFDIKEPYSELTIESQSIVSINDIPKRMDLIHQPLTIPVIWMPWDRIMMQAYLQPPELPESELFELAEYAMTFVRKNNNDIYEVLKDINQTIYREYAYIPFGMSLFTTPFQVYMNKKGVCQDFTNLFICLARLLNIPARYRMGYIYTGGDYENKLQSDASHAWIEVFLPYIGWIGFDPTNGCLAGKNHIRVASGRQYTDATPTSGAIFTSVADTREMLVSDVHVLFLNVPDD